MKLNKFISVIVCIIFGAASLLAQNAAGDKFYNQGMQLQKTMTKSAQNQAISKFRQAKKLYDSAAKKAQCDQAISVSQNIISSLSSGGGGKSSRSEGRKGSQNNNDTRQNEPPTLSVSNTSFTIDEKATNLSVVVTTNKDEWSAQPIANSNGSSFVTTNRTNNNSFTISVGRNNSYATRTQTVQVVVGDLKKEITITQTGQPVDLSVKEQTMEGFKPKGGSKNNEVICNSTMQYSSNNNQNWYIKSQPSWVIVTVNDKRSDGGLLAKATSLGKELVNGKDNTTDDMVKTSIKVTCEAIPKGTAEANNGRRGEVVICSGGSTVTIHVIQKSY